MISLVNIIYYSAKYFQRKKNATKEDISSIFGHSCVLCTLELIMSSIFSADVLVSKISVNYSGPEVSRGGMNMNPNKPSGFILSSSLPSAAKP